MGVNRHRFDGFRLRMTRSRYLIFIVLFGCFCIFPIVFHPLNVTFCQPCPTCDDSVLQAAATDFHYGSEAKPVNAPWVLGDDTAKPPKVTRVNMAPCKPIYGKVSVFVAYIKSSYESHYFVAQESLRCYLRSTNYTVFMVDLKEDKRVQAACAKHDQLFFLKHCAVAVYMNESDWTLVLDADTGVVNPNHCIEEWIDPRVDIIFYERFFNWEVAAGNYLVRNTPFALDFIQKWAEWQFKQPSNWNGGDNGVLQIHLLQTLLPHAKAEIKQCDTIWRRGTNYDTYMAYVTCVKIHLGATRLWPGKIRIYRRAHSWVRDGSLTNDQWCERDFMLHGWKLQQINISGWESPFSEMPNAKECGDGYSGWHWRNESFATEEKIRGYLQGYEGSSAKGFPVEGRIIPYLNESDIAECFPRCEEDI